jgi:hypothetical protein
LADDADIGIMVEVIVVVSCFHSNHCLGR